MGYLSALISLELNVNNETLQTLLLGIFEGLGIVVILYVDRRMDLTQERIGTAVGIAIGIAISVLLEIAIVNSGLEVYSLPALSYLPMLWIWLSALFFPELSSHRTSWRGMLIWLAMMLFFTTASLGLLGIGFLRI